MEHPRGSYEDAYPHIVPLSSQAVEIVETLRLRTGKGALLFPGDRDPEKPISNNTILKALGRMGYKHRMTGHGSAALPPRSSTSGASSMSTSNCSLPTRDAMQYPPRTTMRAIWSLGRE